MNLVTIMKINLVGGTIILHPLRGHIVDHPPVNAHMEPGNAPLGVLPLESAHLGDHLPVNAHMEGPLLPEKGSLVAPPRGSDSSGGPLHRKIGNLVGHRQETGSFIQVIGSSVGPLQWMTGNLLVGPLPWGKINLVGPQGVREGISTATRDALLYWEEERGGPNFTRRIPVSSRRPLISGGGRTLLPEGVKWTETIHPKIPGSNIRIIPHWTHGKILAHFGPSTRPLLATTPPPLITDPLTPSTTIGTTNMMMDFPPGGGTPTPTGTKWESQKGAPRPVTRALSGGEDGAMGTAGGGGTITRTAIGGVATVAEVGAVVTTKYRRAIGIRMTGTPRPPKDPSETRPTTPGAAAADPLPPRAVTPRIIKNDLLIIIINFPRFTSVYLSLF